MPQKTDSIIELLKDGKWHTITEVSQKSQMHEFKVKILTDFLANFSFLEINKKEKKARLSKIFLEFIKKTRCSRMLC